MDKKISLSVLGVLAACMNGKICAQTDIKIAGDERPNILFILSDDHTAQAWGIMEEYWLIMRIIPIFVV